MKAKSSHFDRLVARYYPAVYSFACRLTDDPREAIELTRNAFRSVQTIVYSARSNGSRDDLNISSHPSRPGRPLICAA